MEYALGHETQQTFTTKGTLYGTYNAITGYYQNVNTFKSEEQKLKSIHFGTANQRTQKIFNLCESFSL
jgi:hypothetical protein